MTDTAALVNLVMVILLILTVYFIPAAVASHRRHRNAAAIFMTNLLLGWTFLGWAVAMIWACTANTRPQEIKPDLTPLPPAENVTRCLVCNHDIPAEKYITHVAKCSENYRLKN